MQLVKLRSTGEVVVVHDRPAASRPAPEVDAPVPTAEVPGKNPR